MPRIAQNPRRPSERVLKLQAIWLRALNEIIDIPCGDQSSAMNVRFQLYNAVKAVRNEPGLNRALADAVEQVQVSIVGDGKDTVRIGKSPAAKALGDALEKLGIAGQGEEEASCPEGEDSTALESAKKVMELLREQEQVAPGGRVTPYYTR